MSHFDSPAPACDFIWLPLLAPWMPKLLTARARIGLRKLCGKFLLRMRELAHNL